MEIEAANMIYVSNFNVIGGLETYVYELVKKYHKYDIIVVYNTGHINQIRRLQKYVRVIKNNRQNKYKVKKCFVNYETDILGQVESEKNIQLVHAMFKTQNIQPRIDSRVDEVVAVSEAAAREYSELTGLKVNVLRNPLTIEDEDKALLLISATRLTPEKGKDRMKKLADEMDKANIKYIWLIFTNDTTAIDNPNIVYMKPRLDIRPFLAMVNDRGYGVQLSDCEGDCYFTRECEAFGVPLIVTPIETFNEQHLIEGMNCYYMPFDMENINIERIKKLPSYEGYIRPDDWEKHLVKKKNKYKPKELVRVICVNPYNDIVEKRNVDIGEELFVEEKRANELVNAGVGRRV